MGRGFEVLAGWSSVDRLGSITAPTLLVAGRHDPFTAWPQAHRIADRIADAEVVVFEDSSHFPWIDEPQRPPLLTHERLPLPTVSVRRVSGMSISDDDINEQPADDGQPPTVAGDADGTDSADTDGTDGGGTDGTDADGTDGDTDATDADADATDS